MLLYVLGPEPSDSGYRAIVDSESQGTVATISSVDSLWFTTIQSMETVFFGRFWQPIDPSIVPLEEEEFVISIN